MNCGIGLIGLGLFCLIMAILLISEKARFTPFYTPVKCDNLMLDIPVKYTLHVTPTSIVNGTMMDADYVVTVLGDPATGLKNTGNSLVGTALAPTAAEFAACTANECFVPVPTTCKSDNEFEVTMFDKTKGKIFAPNPVTPTDYSTYFAVGDTTVIGDSMVPVQGSKEIKLGLKMQTPPPLTKALLAGVGVPQPGVTGVCPDGPGVCTMPLFFDLDIKSTVEAGMLGLWLGITGLTYFEDLLPKKFCSQYVKFRADGNGDGYLTTAGPTYCRDSAADIIAKMFAPATHAEASAGTHSGPSVANPKRGTIDQMDPEKEEIDPIKSLIFTLLIVFIILYFILWIVCWAFGAMKIQAAQNEQNAQPTDLERQAAA